MMAMLRMDMGKRSEAIASGRGGEGGFASFYASALREASGWRENISRQWRALTG
jgi:hypothetical protein